jgi:hypothetical protein
VTITRGQKWFAGGAVVLAALLLISHNSQSTIGTTDRGTSGSGSSSPCTVKVTVDLLDVRSNPDYSASVVDTFHLGQVVAAERTIRNGFRQLGPSRWVAREYLDPTPGSDCG